jgi:hypothetical protein
VTRCAWEWTGPGRTSASRRSWSTAFTGWVIPARSGEDDLIEINVPERRLAIVGTGGERQSPKNIDAALERRRRIWKPPRRRHDTGILSLCERVARDAAEGASIT